MIYLVIIFKVLISYSLADIEIKNGIIVKNGISYKQVIAIEDNDILLCNGFCQIVSEDKIIEFQYRGFGLFKDIIKLAKIEAEWSTMQSELQARNSEALTDKQEAKEKPNDNSKEPKSDDTVQIEDANEISQPTLTKENLLRFKVPYPDNNLIFLHTNGGTIHFLPKQRCESADGCIGFVKSLTTNQTYRVTFKQGEIPFWSLKITKSKSDLNYQWFFEDGYEKNTFEFYFWNNNSINFEKALSLKYEIEIL